jgi:Zn ribbon nucleic-acid-binding protein
VPTAYPSAANGWRIGQLISRWREHQVRIVEVVQCQTELLQLIETLCPAGSFARRLNRRQEKGHQHANDGDYDEQFDQRKTARPI